MTINLLAGCNRFPVFGENHAPPADLPTPNATVQLQMSDRKFNGIKDVVYDLLNSSTEYAADRRFWIAYAKAIQSGILIDAFNNPSELVLAQQKYVNALACIHQININAEVKSQLMLKIDLLTIANSSERLNWSHFQGNGLFKYGESNKESCSTID